MGVGVQLLRGCVADWAVSLQGLETAASSTFLLHFSSHSYCEARG